MPLNDKLRAAVFARDKAICSFSGLSLWRLDYGTAPFAPADWPDHIKPASRGGEDTLENLVCASHFHNSKKTNNGSDAYYLFRDGLPTDDYYWYHGALSEDHAETIIRNAAIEESDWYFNRALFNLSVAMDNEWNRAKVTRTSHYWRRAAYGKLLAWRKRLGNTRPTFISRGLVRFVRAPDVQLMLQIADADMRGLGEIYSGLLVHYRANADALHAVCEASDNSARKRVLERALEKGLVTAPCVSVLKRNIAILSRLKRSEP